MTHEPPPSDFNAKRSRFTKEILALHGSALIEVAAAALLTLLISQPVGHLALYSCGVTRYVVAMTQKPPSGSYIGAEWVGEALFLSDRLKM